MRARQLSKSSQVSSPYCVDFHTPYVEKLNMCDNAKTVLMIGLYRQWNYGYMYYVSLSSFVIVSHSQQPFTAKRFRSTIPRWPDVVGGLGICFLFSFSSQWYCAGCSLSCLLRHLWDEKIWWHSAFLIRHHKQFLLLWCYYLVTVGEPRFDIKEMAQSEDPTSSLNRCSVVLPVPCFSTTPPFMH